MENAIYKPKAKFADKFKSLTERSIRVMPFEFISPLPFDKCIYRLKAIKVVTERSETPVKLEYRVHDEDNYRVCEFSINKGYFLTEVVGRLVAYPGAKSTHVEGQASIRLATQIGLVTLWGIVLILLPTAAYYFWRARNYGYAVAMCILILIFVPLFWFRTFGYQKELLREIHMRLKAPQPYHD